MSVALMTVIRLSDELHTTEEYVDRCREEERALRCFTRGLVEVGENVGNSFPPSILVRSRPGPGVSSPHNDTNICHDEYSWEVVHNDGDLSELHSYYRCPVTLIHRSAYEFFH